MRADAPNLDWIEALGPSLLELGRRITSGDDCRRDLWALPEMRALACIDVPVEHKPASLPELGFGDATRLEIVERLSRLDVNCLLALPGPSLSARAVRTLGSQDQQQRFFAHFTSGPRRAFLAVTESQGGSDASATRSLLALSNGQWQLSGSKVLIGGAFDANVGLVLARAETAHRPCLVIVEPKRASRNVDIVTLDTVGLRGAGLCAINFRDFPIRRDDILGAGTGLRADLAIFNVLLRHRPLVGAMALGAGFGLLQEVRPHARSSWLETLALQHDAVFRRMLWVGRLSDQGRLGMHDASEFKLAATGFAERVARGVAATVSGREFLVSPDLRRRYRDLLAFEYMEGTTHIQLLNAYRSWLSSVPYES